MLIANTLQLEIFRGGRFAEVLRLTQGATGRPVDLTGRGPFTCQVRDEAAGDLLLEIEVEETNLADGRLTLVAEQEATAELELGDLGFVRGVVDVIDVYGTRWATGSALLAATISQLPEA